MTIPIDWTAVGPAAVVLGSAFVALLIDAVYPRRTWLGSWLPAVVGLVGGTAELMRSESASYPFAFSLIVLLGTLFVVVASMVMNFESAMLPGKYHFLLLSAGAGGLLLVSARDLATLVAALVLVLLPSTALVGMRQGDQGAARSAWKFFLASAVSTAVTSVGLLLLHGITGSLDYHVIREALVRPDVPDGIVGVAVVLTIVGLLFTLGAVPFHLWIPDTYAGASVMVAAFLSVVVKAAALGAVLTLLAVALPEVDWLWQPIMAVVAAITMTIGNIAALCQEDAVRLLAWSSIAQGGFLLAPAAALLTTHGLTAPVQYLAVYALANLVAFAALSVVLRLRGSTRFGELRGMVRTDPWMGVPLAFATLTLAGFPPAVIGLVTKYLVIRPVVDSGHAWLAVVMAVNITLGLAYYLRLLVVLCDRPDGEPYVSPSPPFSVRIAKATVLLGTAALVAFSVWPDLLLQRVP